MLAHSFYKFTAPAPLEIMATPYIDGSWPKVSERKQLSAKQKAAKKLRNKTAKKSRKINRK